MRTQNTTVNENLDLQRTLNAKARILHGAVTATAGHHEEFCLTHIDQLKDLTNPRHYISLRAESQHVVREPAGQVPNRAVEYFWALSCLSSHRTVCKATTAETTDSLGASRATVVALSSDRPFG